MAEVEALEGLGDGGVDDVAGVGPGLRRRLLLRVDHLQALTCIRSHSRTNPDWAMGQARGARGRARARAASEVVAGGPPAPSGAEGGASRTLVARRPSRGRGRERLLPITAASRRSDGPEPPNCSARSSQETVVTAGPSFASGLRRGWRTCRGLRDLSKVLKDLRTYVELGVKNRCTDSCLFFNMICQFTLQENWSEFYA